MLKHPSCSAARGWLSAGLRERFSPVAVILSPPRCGSTVLARSLWQHPAFRCYLHEPYDGSYHDSSESSLQAVLGSVLTRSGTAGGDGIVVKEMTFQAAGEASELIDAATLPVVLLIRDPRLAVSSRMRRREKSGQEARFPAREAGWQDLAEVRETLRRSGTDYIVVDISDVRRSPDRALAAICQSLGLSWDPRMLSWESARGLRLGTLNGRQDSWYERVLSSTGFEPPNESMPSKDYFRVRKMLTVATDCLGSYEQSRADSRFVGSGASAPGPVEGWGR
jgi:hypothetical protein